MSRNTQKNLPSRRNDPESGNIVLIILLAIILIGMVTAALRSGGPQDAGIDREKLLISATRVKQYASELERGVAFVMQNEGSESAIRFAHPNAPGGVTGYGTITTNPKQQLFHTQGGGVEYKPRPDGISEAGHETDPWEFYGNTAYPGATTDLADLTAVLPFVSLEFCNKINEMNGFPVGTAAPVDTGTCANTGSGARFNDTQQFAAVPNVIEGAFPTTTALDGCFSCGANSYHYFHVLFAR